MTTLWGALQVVSALRSVSDSCRHSVWQTFSNRLQWACGPRGRSHLLMGMPFELVLQQPAGTLWSEPGLPQSSQRDDRGLSPWGDHTHTGVMVPWALGWALGQELRGAALFPWSGCGVGCFFFLVQCPCHHKFRSGPSHSSIRLRTPKDMFSTCFVLCVP